MRTLFTLTIVLLAAGAAAQTPAKAATPAQARTAPTTPAAAAAAEPAAATGAQPPVVPAVLPSAPDTYAYQGDGRRDPFLSLSTQVAAASGPVTRAEGLAGLGVGELSVRGVMKSKGALIATVTGPDKRAYVVHQGDQFADGTVKAVTTDGLVIVQQVNDPLSLVKQREVRKVLRAVEDGKQ
jgi:Tfp pilus assembly protein PilP